MFQVFEQGPIPAPDSRRDLRAKMRNILGYLGFLLGTMIEVTETCECGHVCSAGRAAQEERICWAGRLKEAQWQMVGMITSRA
jgi:hypothetical protein